MPDKSRAQQRFMGAIANDPGFAARMGVPQSVGADFIAADKAAGPRVLPERLHPKRRRAHG